MITAPGYVREIPHRHRLEAGKCRQCGKIYYPSRQVCGECHSREFEALKLSANGKVISFTVIRVAPPRFDLQTPYTVGIVEVDPGVRLMTQIVDCDPDEIEIGMPIKLEFRKIREEGEKGIIAYGYKAVPKI